MQSLAERYRMAREAFELALELGCTPKEAEREMKRRRAAEDHQETTRRLAAKMAAPLIRTASPVGDQPWMMRD